MPPTDVAIAGGGPAGLATAIAARLHGLSVVVCERRDEPLDKACGEGLMPAGVAALARLGVALPERARTFRGIRYLADQRTAEADFPGGDHGIGIRRTELSRALLGRARELDVELRFGTKIETVEAGSLRTANGAVPARFLVAADGLLSPLRRAGGFGPGATPPGRGDRFGVVRHFRLAPWSEHVEVHFGDRAEAYVTPLAHDEIGVAILWSDGKSGFDQLLAERLPNELAARLATGESVGRDRGAGPFRQRVRRRVAGSMALVGDAAGYVDALTGEGLSLAFECAELLAKAMARDDLNLYERGARRLASTPERLTRLTLYAAERPLLRRRLVAALAADPGLFSTLLGILGARRHWSSLGARDSFATLRFLARLAVTSA